MAKKNFVAHEMHVYTRKLPENVVKQIVLKPKSIRDDALITINKYNDGTLDIVINHEFDESYADLGDLETLKAVLEELQK